MKRLIPLIILFMFSKNVSSQEKATFIYIGDPMCSWCYGFSTEIDKVVESLKEDVEFKLVMGGLRPYNTETMANLGDFLEDHWKHVADASEVAFNYGILKDKSFVYDTEPPARAVVAVRQLDAKKELAFFKAVQKAFYVDNKNTNELSTYLPLLEELRIDQDSFTALYNSDEMKKATKADYELSASMGVRGFPSTVLKIGDQYFLTSNGFTKADVLIEKVQNILKQEE